MALMKKEEEDSCSIKTGGLLEAHEGLKRIIDLHRKKKGAGGLQENHEGLKRLMDKYGYSIDDVYYRINDRKDRGGVNGQKAVQRC